MKVNIKARMIDTKLRVALYAMTEFAMSKLVPSKRLRDNVSIMTKVEKRSWKIMPIPTDQEISKL